MKAISDTELNIVTLCPKEILQFCQVLLEFDVQGAGCGKTGHWRGYKSKRIFRFKKTIYFDLF